MKHKTKAPAGRRPTASADFKTIDGPHSVRYAPNIQRESGRMVRVTRRQPCPICDHADWCGIAEDGSIAICMRVADGAARESKNGGYVHLLRAREYRPHRTSYREPEPPPIASINRRHIVYEALLNALPLSERHADDLARRGLSDLAVSRNSYASLPSQPRAIIEICGILALFDDLRFVPGFFTDTKSNWRMAASSQGFLVPVRDHEGRIQACQVRCDFGDPRYIWFSSAGKPNGGSSGAPIHFANPSRVDQTGEAIITEGTLKADVIAERLDCCVVGVPGVSAFALNFGTWLTFKLPTLRKVLVAYDSDWRDKLPVRVALTRLLDSLAEAGLAGALLDWSGAKGLDDLLAREGDA